jgi:hypothetical protein
MMGIMVTQDSTSEWREVGAQFKARGSMCLIRPEQAAALWQLYEFWKSEYWDLLVPQDRGSHLNSWLQVLVRLAFCRAARS